MVLFSPGRREGEVMVQQKPETASDVAGKLAARAKALGRRLKADKSGDDVG